MKTLYWTAARKKDGAVVIRDRHGGKLEALEKASKILLEPDMDEVIILKQIMQVTLPEDADD